MKRILFLSMPLAVFLLLVWFLWVGLHRDPREVPSPFIGKAAPNFTLTLLQEPQKTFSPKDMAGKVWILNVWGSWCFACRQEHPALMEFSRSGQVPILGLDWKDTRQDGNDVLKQLGDPYLASAFDADGRVGIDYGVTGAPETFVIDKQGIVRYKYVGPITPEAINEVFLPLIRKLNRV